MIRMLAEHRELLQLAGDALNEKFRGSIPRILKAGQLLIAGAKADEILYRIRDGWAFRFRKLRDGKQALVDVYLPGDIIGIYHEEASCIRTLTTTVVEVIAAEKGLFELMDAHEIAVFVYQLLIDRQQRSDRLFASIACLDAQGRMATMILDFYRRLETQKLTVASGFHLPMTQHSIGSFLGITTVHVNRVINSLRESGIVNIEKHHVRILNMIELGRLANTDLRCAFDQVELEPRSRAGSQ